MELVLRTGSEDLASGDILKRPSDLVLHSHQNGSSKKPIMQNIQLIKNQVPLHNCVTPINGEMASGDEDTSEVQVNNDFYIKGIIIYDVTRSINNVIFRVNTLVQCVLMEKLTQ